MNNKGFAISGIIYSILILFLLLIFAILGLLGNRKLVLDKMKNNVMDNLNDELRSDVYKDNSGANYPKLADNMIPVTYDSSISKWVRADIYSKWYDYDKKEWANAVVLNSGITKAVGQTIEESEIALMYVWIPRYKYVVFNSSNSTSEEKIIDVIFENSNNTTGTVNCTDNLSGNYSETCIDSTNGDIIDNVSTYTHPGFTFGDSELTGIWVGKFENSTSTCLIDSIATECNVISRVNIKPNVVTWHYASVSNFYDSIKNIITEYGITNFDSHLIKNMEWGAVAYLKQSKYGIGTDTNINNNNTYLTGCGGNTTQTSTCNAYNTADGINSSTTGNIYGIYDMSGGAWEYVMGNMASTNSNFNTNNSEFMNIPNSKYYDLYVYGISNENYSRSKLGDAMKETLTDLNSFGGWYDDKSYFVNSNYPWIMRGGCFVDESNAGIFAFSYDSGAAYQKGASRSVLIKE